MIAQASRTDRGALDFLRQLVRGTTGIVLDASKEYLFESRLAAVLKQEGLESFDALVARINEQPPAAPLRQKVVEAMTTNETTFFRDVQPFDALRKTILPDLAIERATERTLTCWSAAASTGQELYSLAMTIKEQGTRFAGWKVSLLGTDFSSEVLARARAGRFSQLEVNRGLPAAMRLRHFDKAGNDWQIKDDLRQMCDFQPLNLIERWPALPPFDVVMLRNVLIYFDLPTKRQILDRVASVMRPGGLLFLGSVETTLNLTTRFTEVRHDKATCYRAVALDGS